MVMGRTARAAIVMSKSQCGVTLDKFELGFLNLIVQCNVELVSDVFSSSEICLASIGQW